MDTTLFDKMYFQYTQKLISLLVFVCVAKYTNGVVTKTMAIA
jgi:hypothetical protein